MRDAPFRPKPWKPLSEPLFNVAWSSEPDDEEWLRLLRHATAVAVMDMLSEIDRNHRLKKDVKFTGVALGKHLANIRMLSEVFLEGEPSPSGVGHQLNRFVKTLGLVQYDPEPGPTHQWPTAPLPHPTLKDMEALVENAFHGRYERE